MQVKQYLTLRSAMEGLEDRNRPIYTFGIRSSSR